MVKHMIIWKFKDSIDPLHQEVANQLVRPSMEQRRSFDYER